MCWTVRQLRKSRIRNRVLWRCIRDYFSADLYEDDPDRNTTGWN